MASQSNVTESMTNNTAQSADEPQEIVQSLARRGLDDNGQRNWQEESKMYLDAHYPDWKTPQSTRMVPPVFPSKADQPTSGDEAEDNMFDLIKKFGETYCEPMFVVHSYDFAALIKNAKTSYSPAHWVKGECDFVIIHRRAGLIFIEVKAKETTKKVFEGGRQQIEKVQKTVLWYSLKIFKDNIKKKAINKEIYKYPGFVAMPNCSREKSSDFNCDCGLFKEDCEDVYSFKKWWDQKVAMVRTDGGIPKEVYEALLVRLVPINCVAPTLNLQMEDTHRRIILYTTEQLEIMLQSCPKQWITGPAGCGKTVLLIQKVKEVISNIMADEERMCNQERVLVLCFNSPLSVYLGNEISGWFKENHRRSTILLPEICTIKTYDSFLKDVGGYSQFSPHIRDYMERKYSPKDEDMFHHIFVDEGQDFPGCWPELLEKFQWKPESTNEEQEYQTYFWVMFDSNQHVMMKSCTRAELPWNRLNETSRLTNVLRNTEKIFVESKKHFKGLFNNEVINLRHREVGLNVEFDDKLCEDRSNGVEVLSKHIDGLLREKVEKKDVIILTRDSEVRDFLIKKLQSVQNSTYGKIKNAKDRLQSRSIHSVNAIAIESTKRFKGLESKVVIVYDPEYRAQTDEGLANARSLLYIAMSRCFCYLVIVSTVEGCLSIKAGISLPAPHASISTESTQP